MGVERTQEGPYAGLSAILAQGPSCPLGARPRSLEPILSPVWDKWDTWESKTPQPYEPQGFTGFTPFIPFPTWDIWTSPLGGYPPPSLEGKKKKKKNITTY